MVNRPNEFLAEGSLPDGVALLEPSRLKEAQVEHLWSHWVDRQNSGERGLVFHGCLEKDKKSHGGEPTVRRKRDLKGKGKAMYVEIDDSEVDDSEAEESDKESSEEEDEVPKGKGKGKPVAKTPEADCEVFDSPSDESSEEDDSEDKKVTTFRPLGMPPKRSKAAKLANLLGPDSFAPAGPSNPLPRVVARRPIVNLSGGNGARSDDHFASADPAHNVPGGSDVGYDGPLHPGSPAVQVTDGARLEYLKALSINDDYLRLVGMVDMDRV